MTTDQPAERLTITAVWMTDPRDGVDHAWHEVVEAGRWKARCDVTANVDTLTAPEDEYGRCQPCVLALALAQGTELADRLGDQSWRP